MKIVELFIDWNDQEVDELGVDIMSMVSNPAVGYTWQAFSEEPMTEAQQYCWELFQQYGETMDVEDVYMQISDQFEDTTVSAIGKALNALDILGKRDATDEGVIKYQYTGPVSSKTRNFCRAMVQSNKLYSAQELEEVGVAMKREFPTLYPGNVSYNERTETFIGGVAEFLGGPNCQHKFTMVEVFSEGRGPKIVVAKGDAPGLMGKPMADRANEGYKTSRKNKKYSVDGKEFLLEDVKEWHFSDDDERIVVGVAMVPNMYIPRVDEEGNQFYVFFSEETVKKIAEKFLKEAKHNNTDINHDDNVVQENTLLETWLVSDPEMDKSKSLGFDVPKNTWMVSYRVNDEETWKKVKSGELTGWSVAGDFAEKLSK